MSTKPPTSPCRALVAARVPALAAALAAVLAASLWPAAPTHAQEVAVPAVDDAPSAALLLFQATDQAPTNPREAVRLLRTVLDDWGGRPVAVPGDENLFVSAGRRAEAMLFSNAALLEAFRREENAPARELLARGELEQVVATRLATDAGLAAALRLAQSALARARFATAASVLARAGAHDGLKGSARVYHAAMEATALARLGDVAAAQAALDRARSAAEAADAAPAGSPAAAPAAAPTAAPTVERSARAAVEAAQVEVARARAALEQPAMPASPTAAWGEIWNAPLEGPAFVPRLNLRRPTLNPRDDLVVRSVAMPAADTQRVFADDGSGVRAFDRLSGRPLWSHAVNESDTNAPRVHFVAVADDAVVSYEGQGAAVMRNGGRVVCSEAATGRVRWEAALDFADGRGPLGNLVPVGEPIVVDGRVVISARRTTMRQETVSWLFCFDLREPGPPAWASVVATVGSMSQFGVRSLEMPVLAGAGLYVSTGTGAVARFDPATGSVVWLRRFNVPIRDLRPRAAQWELTTPAVADGKVFAISPDGMQVVVLDAESGAELSTLPTGIETPLGQPQYLVGVPGTTLVAAVGTKVVVFDARTPREPAWAWPVGQLPNELGGRVTSVKASAVRPAVIVIPGRGSTFVLDARSGTMVLELATTGNALLLADQLVSADSFAIASFMPIDEAERLCRARLAADATSPDPALSLLQLARQSRRGSVAAEAALEAVSRLGIAATAPDELDGSDDRRVPAEDLFALLLEVDADAFASGADAETVVRALDAVAAAVGQGQRAALARADRLARAGKPAEAALVLADIAMQAEGSALLSADGVRAALDVHALGRLAQLSSAHPAISQQLGARALQEARAGSQAADVRPAPALALRAAARVAHAVRADAATAEIIQMLRRVNASAAQRLAVECNTLPLDTPPEITGAPTRVVEFPGRLCAVSRAVQSPRDQVLTMQGNQLIARRPPEFKPQWKADVGAPDPIVVGIGNPIVAWTEGSAGSGEAVGIDAVSGQVRWRTVPTSVLMGRLVPGGAESELEMLLPGGGSAPLAQVLPAVCGETLVLTRRDGAMLAIDAVDGKVARWEHKGGSIAVSEFAADTATVAIGGSDPDGEADPRVLAVDAVTGDAILDFNLPEGLAPALGWLRILPGGVLAVGSEDGVQARRLAGGDESRPMWFVDATEVQGSKSVWSAGRWLIVLGRFGQLVAIEANTGRVDKVAFRGSEVSSETVRAVESGSGWVAIVRETTVEFFDMDGRFLGRDVNSGDRSIGIAFASHDQLIAVDVSGMKGIDAGAQQFGVEIVRLDAASGGRAIGGPVSLRMVGQRVSAARALDGWVLVSNGVFVQAVDFRESVPKTR